MSMRPPSDSDASGERPADDRLDSWKEIAAYLRRDVTTVQRWEKREGMPVHRHVHDKMGSVYAFRGDLDAWAQRRNVSRAEGGAEPAPAVLPAQEELPAMVPEAGHDPQPVGATTGDASAIEAGSRRRSSVWLLPGAAAVLAAGLTVWYLPQREVPSPDPLADARFTQLTDFGGSEHAAAISRDGRFVAFLSDRDGQTDVWITQPGAGQFYNLTRGAVPGLVNPSVRALGFSPDATLATFWARRSDDATPPDIGVWAVPVLGGQPRPYLDGSAEFDWSSDATRLVYHTPGPGDPMFVREPGRSDARQIFSAPPGLHSHFLVWSPDQEFIYFVQGSLPDRMDIWRIRPTGGASERMTNHHSQVSHPVFVDARTLMYLASDADGGGPWLYSVDTESRMPRRLSVGADRYTSLAASADGTRLVVTAARTKGALWRVPLTGARVVDMANARRLSLTTSSGSVPRLGADYLLYVSSKGDSDSLWKLQGDTATELWTSPQTRIVGAPAIAPDGARVAFSTRRDRQTLLYVANEDGTDARIVADALELSGAPAWAPDGSSLTVAAVADGAPRLFRVPLDGGSPSRFVDEHAVDPAWSPTGEFVVFSGPDIGTTFPVKAVDAEARSYRLPEVTLTRGARHLAFLPGGRWLVVLRGEIRHKDLWVVDLETGAQRQLTSFAQDFHVRDFDLSPDGREIVLEQVQEHSDIVLLEVPKR